MRLWSYSAKDIPTRVDGDLIVGPDEVLEFDPEVSETLEIAGNLIVRGKLVMRPASAEVEHVIRFVDIDETEYVGGGHGVMLSDVGLWADGGTLDLQGTARAGWNRTGADPSWLEGDEIMVAPNKPKDYTFRRFTPGGEVPVSVAADGVEQPTEVFNLTRNVRIEGTPNGRAHIMLGDRVHTLRHISLRYMGPRRPRPNGEIGTEPVLGRYPLHWHHAGEASRGTVVEGVVVRDSSRAFVPHGSNGITFRDCIAYDNTDTPFWWDEGHPSADVTWEHCAAFGVKNSPAYRGLISGFLLGVGTGNKVLDCVAVNVKGFSTANGFNWPEFANFDPNAWEAADLVAHNNPGMGVYVWQNDQHPHLIERLTAYGNGNSGLMHGAYGNYYRYRGVRTWGNGYADIRHLAFAKQVMPYGQEWDDIYCETFVLSEHAKTITPETCRPTVLTNFRARAIVADERVSTPANPFGAGIYVFRCAPGHDLEPGDVRVKTLVSTITVVRSDGTSFTVA